MTNRYNDIIHLQHPTSARHPRMAGLGRAAQFSPFAALTGYESTIQETARLTDAKVELDENKLAALDLKLRFLADHLSERPEISITYFKTDDKKEGGSYRDITGTVKKIDSFAQAVIMTDATAIPITDIFEITGSFFVPLDGHIM